MTKLVASVVAIPQSSTYFIVGEDDNGSLDARIIGWDHTSNSEDFNFATANLPDKFVDVTVSHDAEYMFAIDEAGTQQLYKRGGACHATCTTCLGPGIDNCLSCTLPRFLNHATKGQCI